MKQTQLIDNNVQITHIHAICFLNEEEIVILETKNGYEYCAGGGIEDNESFEQALRRELIEEGQLELISFKLYGYSYIAVENKPEYSQYSLKAIAKVIPLNKEIIDPANKVFSRKIIKLSQIDQYIKLSENSCKIINIAINEFKKFNNK